MILITGGSGFIGSHLVEKLLSAGKKVINIDNFDDFYDTSIKIRNTLESTGNLLSGVGNESLSKKERLKRLKEVVDSSNYKLEVVDIRDEKELKRIFNENNIDCVVNLAALAGVRPSIKKPMLYVDVNIKGYMNILECCKAFKVKKLVQASSSSVYGNNEKTPFKETDIVDFTISPYATTKKLGEVMGHTYYHLYNIDMIQLRFFTVYGPRQRPDLAIHKFTNMILAEQPIPFYGDGTTQRDYTYVDDIVDGIDKSINYLQNNQGVYEILNLGDSKTISLKKMIEVIENKLGKKAQIARMPMQPGDVIKTNANISKAKKLIGYSPSVEFNVGIENFIEWYYKNEHGRERNECQN